jgi:hypothetical protein
MRRKDTHLSMHHLSEEELLRSADGELSPQRASEVGFHLEACWDCRARMEEIETTITSFVRAHHAEFDEQLPPIGGSRAILRTRLTELACARTELRNRLLHPFSLRQVALVSLPLIAIVIGISFLGHSLWREPGAASVLFDLRATPNRGLTPGATRQVMISDVCSIPHEQVIGDVSIALRNEVFQEYGIRNARPEDYEIDYLIAPRLGGTEDIRNLWPEPYRARVWNAHVKDALEERLHQLVCSRQLDLSTAQHDIATDWIAAYKKYFHTNKPLPVSS